MGVPWEQVALATPVPLGPGDIQDRVGDIVSLPVVLALWWLGIGVIYPLSLLSSPHWSWSRCPLP